MTKRAATSNTVGETRVLVVGTGSIGRRHIRNLIASGARVSAFSYRRSSNQPCEPLPEDVTCVDNIAAAIPLHDAVVVANATHLHVDTALAAVRAAKPVFIEKPLSNSLQGVGELSALAEERHLVVECGFMLRVHPNVRWMREFTAGGGLGPVLYARAAVGQLLPQWRPSRDHRAGYGATRATGGGVIFDLIHELDLVSWLVAPVEEAFAFIERVAPLEIETEAIAQIGLRLRGAALAQVHLDYVRPVYARTLEIVGSDGTLLWNYVAGKVWLEQNDAGPQVVHEVPSGFERNWMFREHIGHFLSRVRDPGMAPVASLSDGIEALRVALACHQAAEERRAVRVADVPADYTVGAAA